MQTRDLIRKWRAIYVNSRAEKSIMLGLLGKGIEAYVPLQKTIRQWSDRKKAVELPLFNGYVFVRVTEQEHDAVLGNRGVVGFVRSEGKVAEVRDEEVARLKQLVELGYQLDATSAGRSISSGQKVKVISGALNGLVGWVDDDRDEKQLLIILESIGQSVRVRLPKDVLLSL